MDVYMLPVFNPDGYHHSWTTVRKQEVVLGDIEKKMPKCLN